MRDAEIKNLIINSLGEENDNSIITLELLKKVNYDFDSGFEERVLERLSTKAKAIKNELERRLKFAFMNVSIAAAAAIIILVVSIFLTQGELSVDSLLGVEDVYNEEIVYLLTGN